MPMTHVRVHLNGGTWTVTLSGEDTPQARFARWDDAMDYARGLAIENTDAILEAEDPDGHFVVREEFVSDSIGVVQMRSFLQRIH